MREVLVMISAIAQLTNFKAAQGPPLEFVVFMVCWIILGIASFLFFQLNRNAALKRRIWPPFVRLARERWASGGSSFHDSRHCDHIPAEHPSDPILSVMRTYASSAAFL